MADEPNTAAFAYDQGFALGDSIRQLRHAGLNPDPRWDIADAAKTMTAEDFRFFMDGLNEGVKDFR